MTNYIDSRLRPGEKISYRAQYSRPIIMMTGLVALLIFPLTAYFLLQLMAAAAGLARPHGSTLNGLFTCLLTLYFIHKNLYDCFHVTLAVTDQRIIGRIPRLLLAFSLKPVDLPLADIQEVRHTCGWCGNIPALADYGMVVVVDKGGHRLRIRALARPPELAARISQAAGLTAPVGLAPVPPPPVAPEPVTAPAPEPGPAPTPGPAAAAAPVEATAPSLVEPAGPSPGAPLAPPPKAPLAEGVAEQALAQRRDWKPLAVLAVLLIIIAGAALWVFQHSGKSGKEIATAPVAKTPVAKTPVAKTPVAKAPKPPAPAPETLEPKASTTAPDQVRRPSTATALVAPPPAAKPAGTAEEFNRLGLKEKDPLKKIELYSKAIELDRFKFAAYCNRGYVYHQQKELDKAMQDFNEALQLKPDFAEAYYGRANVHYERKDYDQAMADYSKAIALKPNYASAYNMRGNIFYRRADYDRALADYDKALELNPKFAVAAANRGNVFFEKKDYDQALKAYEQAVAVDPNYAWAYFRRAVIYHQQGDSDQARQNYTKAKSLNPKLPDLAIK